MAARGLSDQSAPIAMVAASAGDRLVVQRTITLRAAAR
jgi:hypothetical protein